MNYNGIAKHIISWLDEYCSQTGLNGYIVGISGGIDSAVTSTLCALTGKDTFCINMPIRQKSDEYNRANEHIENLKSRFPNVKSHDINLTDVFTLFEDTMPFNIESNGLAMANSRARLRMTTLYAVGQANNLLVAGTGNKVEDFGIGFYTKYGDGGVDVSPIADLTKTDVFALAKELNIVDSIQKAKPTDGLWSDDRNDEDQIGATYPELEWAMTFKGNENSLTDREQEVLKIYRRLNKINQHKMVPIPVCVIPNELKK